MEIQYWYTPKPQRELVIMLTADSNDQISQMMLCDKTRYLSNRHD